MSLNTKISLRFFLKFLFTGGFGAICYILCAYLLSVVGLQVWLASSVAFLSLIPIIYFIQKKFVFESGGSHSKSFPRYLTIQLMGLGFSLILPFFLIKLSISPIVTFFCVALLAAIMSFYLQLRWAFSRD